MTLPALDLPKLDSPKPDLPKLDFSNLDLPDLDLRALDLPKLDLPKLDLPDWNLPDLNVSDSLGGLAALANQLQSVINGVIAHPIWALTIVLLTITLIQILADLVKRFVKTTLTLLLRLPLFLSQWIWQSVTSKSAAPLANSDGIDGQIEQLIHRLESLRAEQDQVIEQIKLLVAEQVSDKPDQTAATEARKSNSTVSPDAG